MGRKVRPTSETLLPSPPLPPKRGLEVWAVPCSQWQLVYSDQSSVGLCILRCAEVLACMFGLTFGRLSKEKMDGQLQEKMPCTSIKTCKTFTATFYLRGSYNMLKTSLDSYNQLEFHFHYSHWSWFIHVHMQQTWYCL